MVNTLLTFIMLQNFIFFLTVYSRLLQKNIDNKKNNYWYWTPI